MEDELAGAPPRSDDEWYSSTQELVKPLLACYWSLWQSEAGLSLRLVYLALEA